MNDLTTLETTVINLGNAEQFLRARDALKAAKEKLRDIERLADDAALAFLELNGPLEVNGTLYFISNDKTTKLRPGKLPDAIKAALTACYGDERRFAELLSAQPFKYGALRDAMEEAGDGDGAKFDELYEVVEKKTVEGKPVRKAMAVEKFVVRGRR